MNKRTTRSSMNDVARSFNHILAKLNTMTADQVFDEMVSAVGDMFKADNPNFDFDRFLSVVYGMLKRG